MVEVQEVEAGEVKVQEVEAGEVEAQVVESEKAQHWRRLLQEERLPNTYLV